MPINKYDPKNLNGKCSMCGTIGRITQHPYKIVTYGDPMTANLLCCNSARCIEILDNRLKILEERFAVEYVLKRFGIPKRYTQPE